MARMARMAGMPGMPGMAEITHAVCVLHVVRAVCVVRLLAQDGWWPQKIRCIILGLAAVAQLDRVLGYEPRGRGFDSCQPHQNNVF